MARSWGELLGDASAQDETEEEQRGFLGRLRESLAKSRRALTEQLALAAFDPQDDESWERLELALIQEVASMLGEPPVLELGHDPAVILVVGVNGTGKTTTIGKLAHQLRRH